MRAAIGCRRSYFPPLCMRSRSCIDAKFLLSAVTILAMLAPDLAFAELARNLYWRGKCSNDWNNACNWAVDENTTDANGPVPSGTGADIVIFTKNNWTTQTGGTVLIRTPVNVASFIIAPSFTGKILTGTSSILIGSKSGGLRMGSGRLQIGTGTVFSSSGSITMSGGILSNSNRNNRMRLSGSILHQGGTLSYSGTILFNNNNADQTLRITDNRTVSATYKYAKATLSGVSLNNTAGTTVDDLSLSGATLFLRSITVDRGNLDMTKYGVNLSLSGSMVIASNAQAGFSAGAQTLTISGSVQRGASGYFALSGGTLVLNGSSRKQHIAANNTKLTNFTVTKTSSGILADNVTVLGTLTVNTGSTLAFGANTLYATGSSIVNYGKIYEQTGKIYHTGSNFVVGNSSYSRIDLFREGDSVYFTVNDLDENIDGTVADTLTIAVTLARDGTVVDTETVTLTETAKESGIFRGSVTTKNQAASSENGYLDYTKDANIAAVYTDAQDGLKNSQGATYQVAGGSSTASGGGSGSGGGGGRRSSPSSPVQGPKKTPPPVRRVMKETVKKKTVKEQRLERAKKKKRVKKVLKTKAQLKAEAKAKAKARADARKKAAKKRK